MRIYIPTKGRVNSQRTIENLTLALEENVTIVCPTYEAEIHSKNFPLCEVVVQPDDNMGISAKRKWIVDTTPHEKIVMLDDDLRFAMRREDNRTLFRKVTEYEIIKAFIELEAMLDEEIPHAGFAARGGSIGASAQRGGWQEGKRMMYVLGYHVPTVRKHAIFGRTTTHEDMDVCLQLLTKGFPNVVNYDFVVDQKFGNPGGCTDERNIDESNADVRLLASYFPEYVRVEEKIYLDSPMRLEVVVQWLKALEDGLERRTHESA